MRIIDLMPDDLPPYDEWLDNCRNNRPVYVPIVCDHPELVMTRKTDVLSRHHYYMRCSACSKRISTIKRRIALMQLNGKIPEDDDAFVERNYTNEWHTNKIKQDCNFETAYRQYWQDQQRTHEKYRSLYLRTPRWQTLREEVFRRDGHRCRVCDTTESLQCHHNTYDRLGAEHMTDLETLCATCHANHHIMQNMERESLWLENQQRISQLSNV